MANSKRNVPRLLGQLTLAASLALLGACDKQEEAAPSESADGQPIVAAELEPGKTAASLRLYSVVEAVKGSDIADVKSLEAELNDPNAKLHAIDIDDDGVVDFIEIVEVRKGDKTVLELRAIPSSKKDAKNPAKHAVVVATVELHVDNKEKIVVHATYADVIEHDAAVHVYHHEQPVVVEHGVIVVAEGCFFHHVFVVAHEPYHGHHAHIVIEAPHHDHVHVKHKKHKKHKKYKGHGHGHGHGKGHGGHGVVVTW